MAPRRDNSLLKIRFGNEADRLIAMIENLTSDFYETAANYQADNIQQMWAMAISDFKKSHPEAPEEVSQALAWCYTFDNR